MHIIVYFRDAGKLGLYLIVMRTECREKFYVGNVLRSS